MKRGWFQRFLQRFLDNALEPVAQTLLKVGLTFLLLNGLLWCLTKDFDDQWHSVFSALGLFLAGLALYWLDWYRRRHAVAPAPEVEPTQMPFAWGTDADDLVVGWGSEVNAHERETLTRRWSYEACRWITGIRNTDRVVILVDRDGLLTCLDRQTGRVSGKVDCGRPATGLAATRKGRWAVLHEDGVTVGRFVEKQRYVKAAGATAVAFSDRSDEMAIAASNQLLLLDEKLRVLNRLEFPSDLTGLAWGANGQWLVTLADRLELVTPGLTRRRVLLQERDGGLSGGVVSPSGHLVAYRIRTQLVAVAGLCGKGLGLVMFDDRAVKELEFGSSSLLGIGIGYGDANLISLTEKRVTALKRPDGELSNVWYLQTNIQYDVIQTTLAIA
jgi:hypothetical protein